ncbi:MAG: sigma-70 family RNA polymerase sigma factor, partial [Thermodesulfobacteriota bacterium]
EAKLRNWLYKVAASVCLKKHRSRNRPERELFLEDLKPAGGPETSPDIPDWSHSPVENLMNDELRARLARAVARLPHPYRLVFNLRDFEGFSTEETARILDLTPQAVKTRLHRARAFLRKELADYYAGGAGAGEVGG